MPGVDCAADLVEYRGRWRFRPGRRGFGVGGADGTHENPLDSWRQGRDGALEQPAVAGPGRDIAVAELVGARHVLLAAHSAITGW
jgi:hypothetical protein